MDDGSIDNDERKQDRCQEAENSVGNPGNNNGKNCSNLNGNNKDNTGDLNQSNNENGDSQQQRVIQNPQDAHTREKLFDFIALLQGRRMDDQRAILKPSSTTT